ncbi:MAG: hypothetical protein SFV15_02395 [Polyangiaceae bacterium]|nr:hypothetical protein [Polyangiaceae bacterium]
MSQTKVIDDALIKATAAQALVAIEKMGPAFADLIQKWTQTSNSAALQAVAEAPSGPARKEAKRALGVLKSRGVKLAEPTHVVAFLSKEETTEEAWLLPPDSTTAVGLVVVRRSTTKPNQAVFVFVHPTLGIRRVEGGSLSQSQLKDALQRGLPSPECKAVQVPVEWARYRIALAHRQHAETKLPVPLGWSSNQELLGPVPEEVVPHPFESEGLELADDDARTLAKTSLKLHALPEFRAWFPAQGAIAELLQGVGTRVTPGAEPPQDELQKHLDAEILLATDRYFTPERRAEIAGLMKDCALGILQRDGETQALEVAATIHVIEKAGLITDPPHEVAFLKGFFEKAIGLILSQNNGRLTIPVAQVPPAAAEAGPGAAPKAAEPVAEGA